MKFQEKDCYLAFKNFDPPGPPGCEMAEDKNPLVAVMKLYSKLNKEANDGH